MTETKFHVYKDAVRPQLFVFLWCVWGLGDQLGKGSATVLSVNDSKYITLHFCNEKKVFGLK